MPHRSQEMTVLMYPFREPSLRSLLAANPRPGTEAVLTEPIPSLCDICLLEG